MFYLPLIANALIALAWAQPITDLRGPLQQRCGGYLAPDFMLILDEARPDAWLPANDTVFRISQKADTSGGEVDTRSAFRVEARS